MLSGCLAGLALPLAALGLYGVTAYTVTRRRAEIGVRMARGARQMMIMRLVLTRVAILLGVGVALGSAASPQPIHNRSLRSVWGDARPADDNHPYGHGRFETLSAFVMGVILSGAGAMICYQALEGIGARHAPPGVSAAGALVGAIVLRSIMSSVKFRVGRRLRSSVLIADAWNDAVDILSAVAALIAVHQRMVASSRSGRPRWRRP